MPTAMAAPHCSPLSSTSTSSKSALRASLLAQRAGYDPALGAELAARVLASVRLPAGAVVAGFWPLRGEIDVRPLLLAWAELGHALALPETTAPGQALVFHRWRPGAALVAGLFRTMHPPADPVVPDVMLVPMLGFDRAGHRLGYGAGYYDRTLADLPGVLTIGCAFAAQEVGAVPVEAHDRPMKAIATENEVMIVADAA